MTFFTACMKCVASYQQSVRAGPFLILKSIDIGQLNWVHFIRACLALCAVVFDCQSSLFRAELILSNQNRTGSRLRKFVQSIRNFDQIEECLCADAKILWQRFLLFQAFDGIVAAKLLASLVHQSESQAASYQR